MPSFFKKITPILSLFASTSTLFCCALPALLVAIGAGAAVASLTSTVPQLIWLSKHKVWLFIFAGILLLISKFLSLTTQQATCQPDSAATCNTTKDWSQTIWTMSVVIYAIGLCFAYLLPKVLN
jgi:hypothetical protein